MAVSSIAHFSDSLQIKEHVFASAEIKLPIKKGGVQHSATPYSPLLPHAYCLLPTAYCLLPTASTQALANLRSI